ncbi:hypothetical protein ABE51_21560 [Bacillus thuringiensis]|uniref:Uncharacterized protein n=1 Tax=Bacillus thuringiensis Bt18247 TaxID=1423143 RepID=A0A9W3SNX2_BACTU|nr:hypothetical protein [Bacillus thuringiensis]AOM08949.1 hypothetical protein BTI247_04960 [Bacillus thuringiensis Bt18247]MBG9527675.1 hypothetical protein [Bacillus thuringiensis]
MAKYYGYCYDNEGKFTEIIPLEEKVITEKQTFYREETKEIVTEEKLCELHQSIENGTYVPDPENVEEPVSKHECPNCVMEHIEYETIEVPYEEDVVIGYEPDIPENCTLEVCPDLIYAPIFKEGKWVKTAEPKPEEPKPEEPSELEKLKKQMELTQQALDELLFGGK